MLTAGSEQRLDQVKQIHDYYTIAGNEWKFIPDILGGQPWEKQIEIVQAIFKYKTVAVKTCNAVGKSYIAARIIVTYLLLHPNSIVVTTAPTWRQVKDILWREIATTVKLARRKLTSKEVTQVGLNLSSNWYAVGLSTKYPENFFGYHADHILVVVDEAGGVPEPVFKGVKAITPNKNARVLYIGNPTNPDGEFFESFQRKNIKRFTISAFDTPNLKANGINTVEDLLRIFTPPDGVDELDYMTEVNERMLTPYPALIDPGVVYERYIEWGPDSPAWQALIMGEFPSQSELALISSSLVEMAMGMDKIDKGTGKTYAELSGWRIPGLDPTERDNFMPEYGLDMARFGSDKTVLTPRRGGVVEEQIVWGKTALDISADKVVAIINPTEIPSLIKIDDTGNGGGTTDTLNRLRREQGEVEPYLYRVAAYNFAHAPKSPRFYDFTSEVYWNLKQWFDRKMISLPYDKELFNELVGRRWGLMNGKIKVEDKDAYKKRTGGKSPDKSDSLALAFAYAKPGSATILDDGKTKLPVEETKSKPITSTLAENHEQRYEPARPITSGLNQRY